MAMAFFLQGVSFSKTGLPRISAPASVGNSAPAAFINLNNIVLAGNVYTSNYGGSPTNYWAANMVSSLRLSGDGNIQWTVNLGSPVKETHLVGFAPGSTHTGDFATVNYSVAAYNGIYHIFRLGSLTSTGVTAAANDLCRIRRDGSTLFYEKSSNGGGAWTQLATDAGVAGDLFVHVLLRSNGNFISGLIGSGLS